MDCTIHIYIYINSGYIGFRDLEVIGFRDFGFGVWGLALKAS